MQQKQCTSMKNKSVSETDSGRELFVDPHRNWESCMWGTRIQLLGLLDSELKIIKLSFNSRYFPPVHGRPAFSGYFMWNEPVWSVAIEQGSAVVLCLMTGNSEDVKCIYLFVWLNLAETFEQQVPTFLAWASWLLSCWPHWLLQNSFWLWNLVLYSDTPFIGVFPITLTCMFCCLVPKC